MLPVKIVCFTLIILVFKSNAENVTSAKPQTFSNSKYQSLNLNSNIDEQSENVNSFNETVTNSTIDDSLSNLDDLRVDVETNIKIDETSEPVKSEYVSEIVAPSPVAVDEKSPAEGYVRVIEYPGKFPEGYGGLANISYLYFTNFSEAAQETSHYGVSVVLSSDLVLLRSGVQAMEDSVCKNQSIRLMRGLLQKELWAQQMYDASAKSPTGLLWGDTFQLGNFDECLATKSPADDAGLPVHGQYCLANVRQKNPTVTNTHDIKMRTGPRDDIHWAVCVPASCTAADVHTFVSTLLSLSEKARSVTVPPAYCHKHKPLTFDTYDIAFASLMIFFTSILLACTMYHFYIHQTRDNTKTTTTVFDSIILSFSLIKNLKKIFSLKGHNQLGLDAIAGIRTFAMFFILSGHALIFIFSGPVLNTEFYDAMLKKVEHTLLLSNPLLVDTFLLISAFLFCRLLLMELDKRKGHVNVIPIYIFRYIRVTASYFVVIALYSTWMDKLNSGPLWDSKMGTEKERCRSSWWANVLYINNYVENDKLCMFQSWYLAVDTQLFFLAPAVIYPLWKWPRFGRGLLITTTLVAALIPFFVTYWNELDPTLLPFPKEVTDVSTNYYFKEAYMKTHMRASAYCIGLVSGYILYVIQKSSYKISSNVVSVVWVLSIVSIVSSVSTVSIFYQPGYEYSPLGAALYSALHRIGWAAGTGWILIACATKNAGFLGQLFSWKPFIPLGRLTYCAYLMNGLVELHAHSTLRNSIHLSIFNMTVISFSHIMQTFACALVLCLMFESPIHGFEKILLSTLGNKTKNRSLTRNEEGSNPETVKTTYKLIHILVVL